MKKFGFVFALGAVGVFMLLGCATPVPIGTLYTRVKFPVTATSNSSASSKTGEAECISVLLYASTKKKFILYGKLRQFSPFLRILSSYPDVCTY